MRNHPVLRTPLLDLSGLRPPLLERRGATWFIIVIMVYLGIYEFVWIFSSGVLFYVVYDFGRYVFGFVPLGLKV